MGGGGYKLGCLSADIICFSKLAVFRERSSSKTVSFEEQKMPKDRHPSVFQVKMEAVLFFTLQIFLATHAVLKIGECSRIFPALAIIIANISTPQNISITL